MTRVTLYCDGSAVHMQVTGHAGYSEANRLPAGCDIVCAALSMVCCMAAERMAEMEAEGKAEVWQSDQACGRAELAAGLLDPDASGEFMGTVRTAAAGFRLLAERYPDFVCAELGDVEPVADGVGETQKKT